MKNPTLEELNASKEEALNVFALYEQNRRKHVSFLTRRIVVEQNDWDVEEPFMNLNKNKENDQKSKGNINNLVNQMRNSITSEVSNDIDGKIEINNNFEEQKMPIKNNFISTTDKEFGEITTLSRLLRIQMNDNNPIVNYNESLNNNINQINDKQNERHVKFDNMIQVIAQDRNYKEHIHLSIDGKLKHTDERRINILSLYALASKDRELAFQKAAITYQETYRCYESIQNDFVNILELCHINQDFITLEELHLQKAKIQQSMEEYDFFRERLESIWDDIGRYERLESIDQHRVEEIYGKREDILKEIEKERKLGEIKERIEEQLDEVSKHESILTTEEKIEIPKLKRENQFQSKGSIETGWNQNSRQLKEQAEIVQKRQVYMINIARKVRKRWKQFVLERRFLRMSDKVDLNIKTEAFFHWYKIATDRAIDRYTTLRKAWDSWIVFQNKRFYLSQKVTEILNNVYYNRLVRMCFIFWKRWYIYKKMRKLNGIESSLPQFDNNLPWWNTYITYRENRQHLHKKAIEAYKNTLLTTCFYQIQNVAMENHQLRIREKNFTRVIYLKTIRLYFYQWKNFIQFNKDNKDKHLKIMKKILKSWKNLVEVKKREAEFPTIKRKILLREGFLRWRKRYLQMRLLENSTTVRIITKRPLALLTYSVIAEDHIQYSCVNSFNRWKKYWIGRRFFYWYIGKEWQNRRKELLQYYFYILKNRELPPSRSNLDIIQDYNLMNEFKKFKREFLRTLDKNENQTTMFSSEEGFNIRMKYMFNDFMKNADPKSKTIIFQKIILLSAARKRELDEYRTNTIISGDSEDNDPSTLKANIQRKFALARKVVGLFIKKQMTHSKDGVDELTAMLEFMKMHISRNRKLMAKKIKRDRELALKFLAKEAAIQLASVSKTFKAVVEDIKLSSIAQAQLLKIQEKRKEMEEKLDQKRNEKMDRAMHFVRTVVHKLKEKSRSHSSIIWDEILESKKTEKQEESNDRPKLVHTASGRLTEIMGVQNYITKNQDEEEGDINVVVDIENIETESIESQEQNEDELENYKKNIQGIFNDSEMFEESMIEDIPNDNLNNQIHQVNDLMNMDIFKNQELVLPFTPQSPNPQDSLNIYIAKKKDNNLQYIPELSKPLSAISTRKRPKSKKSQKSSDTQESIKSSSPTFSFDRLFTKSPKLKNQKISTVVVPGKIQELKHNLNDSIISHESLFSESNYTESSARSQNISDEEVSRLSNWIWDYSFVQEPKIFDISRTKPPTSKEARQVLSSIHRGDKSGKIQVDSSLKDNDFINSIISLGKEIESSQMGKQNFIIQEDSDGFVVHLPKEIHKENPLKNTQLPFHERMLLRTQLENQKKQNTILQQKILQQKRLEKIMIMQKESEKWKLQAAAIVNDFKINGNQEELYQTPNHSLSSSRRLNFDSKMSNADTVTALELILKLNLKQEKIYSEEIMQDLMELRKNVYSIIMALKESETYKPQKLEFEKALQRELDQMKLRMSDMEKYLDIRIKDLDTETSLQVSTSDQIPVEASLPYILDMKHRPSFEYVLSNQERELIYIALENTEDFKQQWLRKLSFSSEGNIEEIWNNFLNTLASQLHHESSKVREEAKKVGIRKRILLSKQIISLSNLLNAMEIQHIQTQKQKNSSMLFDNVYFQDKMQQIKEVKIITEHTLKISNQMMKDLQAILGPSFNQLPQSEDQEINSNDNDSQLNDFNFKKLNKVSIKANNSDKSHLKTKRKNRQYQDYRSQDQNANLPITVQVKSNFGARRHSSVVQTPLRDLKRAKFMDELSRKQ